MGDTGVYRLTWGSNNVAFNLESYNNSLSRDIWEMPMPYIKEQIVYDNMTTTENIILKGKITTGTGYAYSTIAAAITACKSLLPDDIVDEGSLLEYNVGNTSATGHGDVDISSTSLMLKEFSYELSISDALSFITITATLVKGGVL